MKRFVKEIKQEENIMVLCNAIEAIYYYYRVSLPNHINKKVENLINELEKEYTKDYLKNYDIAECEIIERITFEKSKKDDIIKNKEGVFNV